MYVRVICSSDSRSREPFRANSASQLVDRLQNWIPQNRGLKVGHWYLPIWFPDICSVVLVQDQHSGRIFQTPWALALFHHVTSTMIVYSAISLGPGMSF